jgi:hypothetical protein
MIQADLVAVDLLLLEELFDRRLEILIERVLLVPARRAAHHPNSAASMRRCQDHRAKHPACADEANKLAHSKASEG